MIIQHGRSKRRGKTIVCDKCGFRQTHSDAHAMAGTVDPMWMIISNTRNRYDFCPDCVKRFNRWLTIKPGQKKARKKPSKSDNEISRTDLIDMED